MDDENYVVSVHRGSRQSVAASESKGRPRGKRRLVVVLVGVLLIGVLLAGGAYWLNRDASVPAVSAVESQAAAQEAQDIIELVGRHIDLPANEEPTVATVSDPEKLREQPFFAQAKVGYKVLLYTKAKKAYLYDPKRDKLVEVAPITTE